MCDIHLVFNKEAHYRQTAAKLHQKSSDTLGCLLNVDTAIQSANERIFHVNIRFPETQYKYHKITLPVTKYDSSVCLILS